jgi:hypothetical protein
MKTDQMSEHECKVVLNQSSREDGHVPYKAKPIYQRLSDQYGTWSDVSKDAYLETHLAFRRILYNLMF